MQKEWKAEERRVWGIQRWKGVTKGALDMLTRTLAQLHSNVHSKQASKRWKRWKSRGNRSRATQGMTGGNERGRGRRTMSIPRNRN